MTDFINRDELRENMLYAMCGTGYQSVALAEIDLMPSVDAVPVRHGKWIEGKSDDHVRCSFCNEDYDWTSEAQYYNYCPNCGARMDAEDE